MKTKQGLFLLFFISRAILAEHIDFISPSMAEKIEQWYLSKTKDPYAPLYINSAIKDTKHCNRIPGDLLVMKPNCMDYITLWDLSKGELIHSFQGKDHPIFNNDYTLLATRMTTNAPHETNLYSLLTGELIHTIKGEYPLFSPDGTRVVTVTSEKHLEAQESTLWNIATNEPIYTFKGECICFSPDDSLLIVKARNDSTREEELRALNAANGKIVRVFENGHPSFSRGGKQLVIETYNNYTITWEVNL